MILNCQSLAWSRDGRICVSRCKSLQVVESAQQAEDGENGEGDGY